MWQHCWVLLRVALELYHLLESPLDGSPGQGLPCCSWKPMHAETSQQHTILMLNRGAWMPQLTRCCLAPSHARGLAPCPTSLPAIVAAALEGCLMLPPRPLWTFIVIGGPVQD